MSAEAAAAGAPADIATWRREQRKALLQRRLSASAEQRQRWSEAIRPALQALLGPPAGRVLGFCWPYQGEADVTPFVRQWLDTGGQAALPVVLRPREPMIFRRWEATTVMTQGVYEIPIPTDTPEVQPQVLLVPLTGFDAAGFRLGYGGGFFDRTVAEMEPRPLMVGVGFELSRLASIHPQPHDLPMDFIVTERGCVVLRAEP